MHGYDLKVSLSTSHILPCVSSLLCSKVWMPFSQPRGELRRRTAACVGGLKLPLRVAENGEILFETGPERLGEKWILFEHLQHQRHGLVIRGDEAARVLRVDEEDHDTVVMQRRADLRN